MSTVRSRIRDQVTRIPIRRNQKTDHIHLRLSRSREGGVKWAVMALNDNGHGIKDTREPCDREDQVLTYVQEAMERMNRECK